MCPDVRNHTSQFTNSLEEQLSKVQQDVNNHNFILASLKYHHDNSEGAHHDVVINL